MKICFVVMGYGKKTDYQNRREVDLDEIYEKVILRSFDGLSGYEVIRANELAGSNNIDTDMYELLLMADLVIADITTLNPNAIYELGVRHALRPHSTIIMMMNPRGIDENGKIIPLKGVFPFDLNHNRFVSYDDYGDKLDDKEAASIRDRLREFIMASESDDIDSPFYKFVQINNKPTVPDSIQKKWIKKAHKYQDEISGLLDEYEKLKKTGDFVSALEPIARLYGEMPHNEYFTQQYAFCTYSAGKPDVESALKSAWEIISTLNPE